MYKNNNNVDISEDGNTKINISSLNREIDLIMDNFENEQLNQKGRDENGNANLWISDLPKNLISHSYAVQKNKKESRVPWFIIYISCLQLSIYLVADGCINNRLMLSPEHHANQLWRYVTYIFVHSDCFHLILNICLQLSIGSVLEGEQERWKVAFIYIAGGLSGSVSAALLQPHLSLLGASAAVYALLTSHIGHIHKNFSKLSYRFLRIIALIILLLSDIVFTAYHFAVNGNAKPRICLEAHIAGAIAGLCLGYLVYGKKKA